MFSYCHVCACKAQYNGIEISKLKRKVSSLLATRYFHIPAIPLLMHSKAYGYTLLVRLPPARPVVSCRSRSPPLRQTRLFQPMGTYAACLRDDQQYFTRHNHIYNTVQLRTRFSRARSSFANSPIRSSTIRYSFTEGSVKEPNIFLNYETEKITGIGGRSENNIK